MAGIKDYSTTASNNTSVGGVSIAEGMLPSNINNAFRAVTADMREWYNDAQWIIYGDGDGAHTFTYSSATAFRVDGANVTTHYHAGRRVKAVGSSTGTIFGTIASTSFSTNTTVNVTWDSGSLQNESLVIYLAILTKTNNSIPEDSISSAKLTSDSVTTAKITDANVTAAKLATNAVEAAKINANAVTEGKINAGAVTTTKIGADAVTNAKIADDSIDSEHYVDGSIDTAHIGDNQVTAAKIADAVIVTNSEHSSATPDDVTFFTTSASDGRYFRQDSTETIASGDTWSSDNARVATTAAIDARVIDLVDDVGGFVPIANELAFPNANPDVNDGAGTLVSIKTLSQNYTSSGSGVITIANGTVGNSTVTINGAENSTTYSSGFGLIVETTTTLNTYTFHRLVPKATEVTTVAGKATEIGRLGTADAVSDMNVLGTTQNVSDMNTLAAISGLSTLAANSANVTTVANNLSSVNNFAEVYRISSSAPTDSLNVGDLYFDTTANELKVYKSSGWAAAGSTVNGTSARFTYTASGGQTTFTGSDDNGNTLAYDAGFADVYLNGVKLVNGTDVTITSGTSVVLASGATAGDIVDIVGFGTFNVAAIAATSITSGTLSDARLPTTMASKTLTGATVTTTYNGLTVNGDGGSNDGQIQLNCSQNSHGVKIKAPPHSAGQSYTLTLPSSITNDYYLKTDGSGNLSFAEVSGGTSWQSVQTSNFTAAAGKGYPINTTSGAITVTFPASAAVGDTIVLLDYARTFGTNKITINPNGINFQGNTTPQPEYNTNGQSITCVYIDSTKGWIPTVDDDVTYETPPPTLTNISGSILVGLASNLTLTGTEFGTSGLVVNFLQSSDSINENVTVTPASTTSAVVAVPAAVYNNITAGNAVTMKVTNSVGGISNTLNTNGVALPTGGTITTHGSFRVHTFTSSGNYVVPSGFSATHDTLIVAGGGAGGNWHAGGGGAGGMITYNSTPSAATYSVVVGAGGAGGYTSVGSQGGSSEVFSQSTVGGGRGGNYNATAAGSGGSGAGGNGSGTNSPGSGTSGQGNDGGSGSGNHGGGGGGGKGATGSNSPNTNTGGAGGIGGQNDYQTGSNQYYAGGGGGGTWGGGSAAAGGNGGGGNGSYSTNSAAPTAGSANTGGGGGGNGGQGNAVNRSSQTTGGSGIVIIRYAI